MVSIFDFRLCNCFTPSYVFQQFLLLVLLFFIHYYYFYIFYFLFLLSPTHRTWYHVRNNTELNSHTSSSDWAKYLCTLPPAEGNRSNFRNDWPFLIIRRCTWSRNPNNLEHMFAFLTLRPCKQKQYVLPKRWSSNATLDDATTFHGCPLLRKFSSRVLKLRSEVHSSSNCFCCSTVAVRYRVTADIYEPGKENLLLQ